MTREEAWPIVRDYLWCPYSKRYNDYVWSGKKDGKPPFTWSKERPAPTVKRLDSPLWTALGHRPVPARDFPNPDYVWAHPSFEIYIRYYAEWDEMLTARREEAA